MDVSAIADVNSAVAAQRATSRGFADISSEDFFGLMIAELQAQDPLDPKDNQQLLSQMSSIRQMEQSAALTKTLQSLANEQRFGTTAGLIGNYIAGTVTDQAGTPTEIQGLVIGVRFEGSGNAVLELHNGRSLPVNKVEQVTLVENLPPDILEQLQAELEGLAGGTEDAADGEETEEEEPVEGEAGDGSAARSIIADAGGRTPSVGTTVSDFGRRVNVVGDLLDSLLSPGFGLKIGR